MALKGLTYTTAKGLDELAEGYKESDKVKMRRNGADLSGSITPLSYDDKYTQTAENVLKDYLARDDYDFNINTDKLYKQYADQYKKQGEAAMRDTVADASALTGGYASSYGITAGAQAYQSYLDKLNDIVPELERMAYERYEKEGDDTKQKLDMISDLDSSAYEKFRDKVSDAEKDRERRRENYQYESEADREAYKLLADYLIALAKLENQDYYNYGDLEVALRKLEK